MAGRKNASKNNTKAVDAKYRWVEDTGIVPKDTQRTEKGTGGASKYTKRENGTGNASWNTNKKNSETISASTYSKKPDAKTKREKRELDVNSHAHIIDAHRTARNARREYSPLKGRKLEDKRFKREVKTGKTSVSVHVVGNPRVKVKVVEDGRNVLFDRLALRRMAKTGEYKVNNRKK